MTEPRYRKFTQQNRRFSPFFRTNEPPCLFSQQHLRVYNIRSVIRRERQQLCSALAFHRASPCLCMQRAILLWQIRLSVCPSVTLWYCIETNAHIVKLFPLSGMTLSFLSATVVTKFHGEIPQRGRQIQGGGKIYDFF